MSIRLMAEVWELGGLDPSQKLVLLSLADNSNDAGVCWPSIANMVRKTGLSERMVQYALAALVEQGHLSRNDRPGRSTVYTVHPRNHCTQNHQVTIIEPSKKKSAAPPTPAKKGLAKVENLPAVVPNLDAEAWDRWLEFRKEIRKPVKAASLAALAKKLAAFGDEQKAVVEQSIAFGWVGLFPLKENENGRRTMGRATTTYEIHAQRLENWARDNGVLGRDDPDVRDEVVADFLNGTPRRLAGSV